MNRILFEDLNREQREKLISSGAGKLRWAEEHMPVLRKIGEDIKVNGSLKGIRIAMALHTEAKTGILALTLARAGAAVRLTSCNPLSTDDPVAIALPQEDVAPGSLEVRARYGETREEYFDALNWAIDMKPQVVIDDGGDLVKLLHTDRREMLPHVIGGCEETTTGIIRLISLQKEGKLEFPMMDVNDCDMKHLFDNRYGTGQSTVDGILTATNLSIAGRRCVVAGYGWCGRGIAMRLKGLGANVTVCEVDPVKAVEASMDGFRVHPMEKACLDAGLIVTATGCRDVIGRKVIPMLPDGVILANAGHFNNEIDLGSLESLSDGRRRSREFVDTYMLSGRSIHVLSQGRLVNLVAGQGHPVEIMDMSFAIQAAGAEMIATKGAEMNNEVIRFPRELDEAIARLKLEALGYSIDELSEDQIRYLNSWEEGT
ncbi:MAG: adenosylhomocysteinase [Thermoplasmatota archaeon]